MTVNYVNMSKEEHNNIRTASSLLISGSVLDVNGNRWRLQRRAEAAVSMELLLGKTVEITSSEPCKTSGTYSRIGSRRGDNS